MADLFEGQSLSKAYRLTSGGAAYTLQFDFQPDKVVFTNLTQWAGTAANLPVSVWYRDETAAGFALQQQVTDTAAAQSFNFLNTSSNGFTVADTSGGGNGERALISAVSQADPCVVTTSAAHGLQDGQVIRITDLGSDIPTARGMDEINNKRFEIDVLTTTTFSLKEYPSGAAVDSTSYVAYVSGGRVLAVPQRSGDESSPFDPESFKYDPVLYKLTAGTSVMGDDGDNFLVEAYRFGEYQNLGDIG